VALVERSAKIVLRSVPYFAWRYGDRGRSFGRSDAGYLVTPSTAAAAVARQQVAWLARVLAARGMPRVLLESQLESLGRLARRQGRAGAERLLGLAAELRGARLGAIAATVWSECERLCRDGVRGDRRPRWAGVFIAASVTDRVNAVSEHDDTLVAWFQAADPGDATWQRACAPAYAFSRASTERGTA